MFNEVVKTIEWGGAILELHTGKIARQADGAVLVKMGGTVVLCTTVSSKEVKEGASFFPLTVHYREMAYAAGKIPGGFIKREGKPTDKEVLVSRLIDRPIRPLFHSAFFNETQIICTVLSYDAKFSSDILAIIGSSAALALSGVPYQEIIAACRVGLIGEKLILNPSVDELKNSELDLIVAGSMTSIMMVESEAELLSEEKILEAIEFGHQAFQPVINLIKELAKEAGKPKWLIGELFPEQLKEQISALKAEQIRAAFTISAKQDRTRVLSKILTELLTHFTTEEYKFTNLQIEMAFEEVKAEIVRGDILTKNVRIDGRKSDEIRKIACEVSMLPKTHGSSLFTRGETQALVITTLGTGQDEQIVDSLDGEYKERLMLNYIFPPYSVGETTPLRGPGRREVGHGRLAWRAIKRLLPTKEEFPYSIRIVSEVTECNGSSSMATVCGSSMALMDAGVPIKSSIAGIAMGLIKLGEKFVVLSDIIGDEDQLGDMDFKVAGSKEGITALQMDIKIAGINFNIMQQALCQAKEGRIHILNEMEKIIAGPEVEISKYAPSMCSFKISKDKIRDVIGAGGKVIREICETTSAKIDIADDGSVFVSALGKERMDMAVARIKELSSNHAIGDTFNGSVVKILDNGAFINYSANKDGFVHISEIANERIESVSLKLKHGDIVKVKIIGFDNKGKAKLTIKSAEVQIDKEQREEIPSDGNEHNNNESRRKLTRKPYNPQNNVVIKERKYFS